MTNDERAALVERLRKYVFDDDDTDKAADQIEADGKRIAELEGWKAAEQAHHHLLELRIEALENNLVNAAREILGLKDALAQVGVEE